MFSNRLIRIPRTVILCLLISVACTFGYERLRARDRPKNLIVMIADGQGMTQITAARYLKAYKKNPDLFPDTIKETSLAMDSMEYYGYMGTYPDDRKHLVTDSAAAGTALATGFKTSNGAISGYNNDSGDFVPLKTVLEAAEDKKMATGIVTTSRVTHATPAVFSAHTPDRNRENRIAVQQLNQGIEVVLGGGRRHFLPKSENGARGDTKNLIQKYSDQLKFVETARQLSNVRSTPVVGLFDRTHMDYYLNRQFDDGSVQPGLPVMTRKAIQLLKDEENGFFLMVESARIDHLGHANDPAMIHETLEFDRAVETALNFARRDERTLVVVTADHETGGMGMGREGVYDLNFRSVHEQKATASRIESRLRKSIPSEYKVSVTLRLDGYRDADSVAVEGDFNDWNSSETLLERVDDGWETRIRVFPRRYRYRFVVDGHSERTNDQYRILNLRDRIKRPLPDVLSNTMRRSLSEVSNLDQLSDERMETLFFKPYLTKRMLNEQTLMSWTTSGHSGVDVPLFAEGPGAARFSGSFDNAEVGKLFFEMIGAREPVRTSEGKGD